MKSSSELSTSYELRNNRALLALLLGIVATAHFYLLKAYSLKTLNIHYSNNISEQTSIKVQLSPIQKTVPIKKKKEPLSLMKKTQLEKNLQKDKPLETSELSSNKQNHKSLGQADLYAKYITNVRRLIAENKFYPLTAKRLQQEGTVKLKLVIGREGQLLQQEVIEASNYSSLEYAALKTIKSIDSFGKIPQALNKESITIIIPIIYELI